MPGPISRNCKYSKWSSFWDYSFDSSNFKGIKFRKSLKRKRINFSNTWSRLLRSGTIKLVNMSRNKELHKWKWCSWRLIWRRLYKKINRWGRPWSSNQLRATKRLDSLRKITGIALDRLLMKFQQVRPESNKWLCK